MNFGQSVVDNALQFQGTPYQWGGDSTGGIDCSGLVQQVYARLGINLPRTTYDQVHTGTAINDLSQAQAGDLVFLHPSQAGPGHVGIYLGGGMIIDANHTGGSVGIRSLNGYGPIVAIRRVVSGGETGTAGTNLPTAANQPPQNDMAHGLDVIANAIHGTGEGKAPTVQDPMTANIQPQQQPQQAQQGAASGSGSKSGLTGEALLRDAAAKAGFTGKALDTAVAVGMAESGGNAGATNTAGNSAGTDRGAWQINDYYHKDLFSQGFDWADPYANARAAYQISNGGQNWQPWSTFNSGAYRQYMGGS